MKTVLVYGDSLTWGSIPGETGRHPRDVRWPSVMANKLGQDVEVITDGLRGRLTAYDEYLSDSNRNGSKTLATALYAHAPLDLVILMLGTNDMQPHVAGTAIGAMQGIRRLVTIIQKHMAGPDMPVPEILIVSPPGLCQTDDEFYTDFFAGRIEEISKLGRYFQEVATEKNCKFFDAATVCRPSPIDGVHLDAENTIKLGEALASTVQEILFEFAGSRRVN